MGCDLTSFSGHQLSNLGAQVAYIDRKRVKAIWPRWRDSAYSCYPAKWLWILKTSRIFEILLDSFCWLFNTFWSFRLSTEPSVFINWWEQYEFFAPAPCSKLWCALLFGAGRVGACFDQKDWHQQTTASLFIWWGQRGPMGCMISHFLLATKDLKDQALGPSGNQVYQHQWWLWGAELELKEWCLSRSISRSWQVQPWPGNREAPGKTCFSQVQSCWVFEHFSDQTLVKLRSTPRFYLDKLVDHKIRAFTRISLLRTPGDTWIFHQAGLNKGGIRVRCLKVCL